jgi:hypothetical protein
MEKILSSLENNLTKDKAKHMRDELVNGFTALKTGIAVSSKI